MTADLFVRGATVYPGDGPGGVLDVAVTGGVIEAVGPALAVEARETVEAAGLMLCPGFVDMHAHSALRSFSQPLLEPKIGQGFTTELINPDGLAPAPVAPERREERRAYLRGLEGDGPEEWGWSTFDEYLQALEATRPATTLVPSIGHSAVRDVVLGGDRRAPGAVELRRMRDEVRFGLEAGARTLSFGLLYLPGAYANTDELAALAEVAAEYGAPLVPHIRNEGLGVLGAAAEMLDVARRSGAPLHISHLKCLSDERLVEPLLELLERASADVDLSFDQYPYGAGSTLLSALLPVWAQEGGASATLARLERPAERARIARDVEHGLEGWENFLGTAGPERIVIANAGPPNETAAGRSLAELAAERGQEPVEAVCSLLLESQLDVTMIEHYASDQTVKLVAAHRLHLVGSDGIFGAKPHPRLYGAAARFLGRFVLREQLVSVEEAVARLSARAADRLGLSDRGRIRRGQRADLVLLDPARFVDTGTYDDPARHPDGVVGVWVAGRPVWREGRATGERPGGVVREPRR
ncbi:MAG TPA: amidohydrolase family protein [Gaiellaceae bacterium]|nr:amidohydrolase family protein [Gaiellaceae bacterium]